MKIGVDIDGVLNSQYNFSIEYGSKFCNELGNYFIKNINAFDTTDMFGWSEEIAHQFWNKYRETLVSILPAKPFASEVLNKLKNENNEIYIITARRNDDEWFPEKLQGKVDTITKKWLEENHIPYHQIHFDVKNKGEFCKKNDISFMIEDEPKNLKSLMGNTNVIVFDYPYNRNTEFNHLLRAYSWYDIYHTIKSFDNY